MTATTARATSQGSTSGARSGRCNAFDINFVLKGGVGVDPKKIKKNLDLLSLPVEKFRVLGSVCSDAGKVACKIARRRPGYLSSLEFHLVVGAALAWPSRSPHLSSLASTNTVTAAPCRVVHITLLNRFVLIGTRRWCSKIGVGAAGQGGGGDRADRAQGADRIPQEVLLTSFLTSFLTWASFWPMSTCCSTP